MRHTGTQSQSTGPMPSPQAGGTVTLEDLPLLLTVDEVAEVLRIGRNGAYAAVANGCIRSVRIGRIIRIPRAALAALIAAGAPSTADEQEVTHS